VVRRIAQAPIVALRWLAVGLGVLGWLIVVPLLEIGRSLARSVHRASSRGRRRAGSAPLSGADVAEIVDIVDERNARDARRRAG
jgi:hypothetical protein